MGTKSQPSDWMLWTPPSEASGAVIASKRINISSYVQTQVHSWIGQTSQSWRRTRHVAMTPVGHVTRRSCKNTPRFKTRQHETTLLLIDNQPACCDAGVIQCLLYWPRTYRGRARGDNAPGAEKSQQHRNYCLQCSIFLPGGQTCFRTRTPNGSWIISLLITIIIKQNNSSIVSSHATWLLRLFEVQKQVFSCYLQWHWMFL